MQHFDRCMRTEMNMFTQVDLRKATFSKQANELIVTQPLPHAVRHLFILFYSLLHRPFVDLAGWLNRNPGCRWLNRHGLLLFDNRQGHGFRFSFPQRRKRITTVCTESCTSRYRLTTIWTGWVRKRRYLWTWSSF